MIGEPGVDYNAGSDEFGVITFTAAPAKAYKIGDKIELIVPHCDPVVNLYDQMYGIRNDRVEKVITDHRAGAVSVGPEVLRS